MSGPFKQVSILLKIHLPPCYISDIRSGIEYRLNQLLRSYVEDLEGIMLAYWNIGVQHELGEIIRDDPHVHFTISADVLIFCPSMEKTLTGRVNKIGVDHIGLLVFGAFNVSVPFDQIPPFYIRDTTEDRFSCVGEDGAVLASIAVGSLLQFTVKSINHTGDIFSIGGSLLQRATGPVGVQLPPQLFNKRKGEKKQGSVSENGTPNKPKDNFAKPASKTPTKQKTTTIVTPNTTPSKPNNTPKSETKSNGTHGNKTPKVETPSKTVATASSAKKKKRQVAEDEVETSQSQSQQDVVEEVELPVQEIKKKRKKGSTPS